MATVSFSQIANLRLSTKQFQGTDTTDYAGQGLPTTYMYGCFNITASNGDVVYYGGVPSAVNYDIHVADSRYSIRTMAMPLNTDGTATNDTYTIVYTVWDDDNEVFYSTTETFNFTYTSPVVQINGTVAVYTPSPLITLQDETVYVVNSITPTIDRTATISYEAMVIGGVLSTPTPTVGTTATTTSNTFYSPTTELLSVITNLSYAYASNFKVLDTVWGSESLFVDATSYCSTVCGLNEMAARRQANPNDSQLATDFALAMSYWTLIMANQTCGNSDLINGYLTQIQALGSFNSDCTCCDGEFQQVVGLGGLVSAYDIISANSYIGVTSSSSGGTKTYVLTLSQTFIDLVDSILGATLVAGNNIALSSSTVGANTTWTINGKSTVVTSVDNSIDISSSTTSGTTTYDLSVNGNVKYATAYQSSIVGIDTNDKDYNVLSGVANIVTTGMYELTFEADVKVLGGETLIGNYWAYKNSTPATNISIEGTGITTSDDIRTIDVQNVSGSIFVQKMVINTLASLTAGDAVSVNLHTTTLSDTADITHARLICKLVTKL